VHELCANPVIAVRLCTLGLPTERQRPPVLFRWLDGLAFPELRASSATSCGHEVCRASLGDDSSALPSKLDAGGIFLFFAKIQKSLTVSGA